MNKSSNLYMHRLSAAVSEASHTLRSPASGKKTLKSIIMTASGAAIMGSALISTPAYSQDEAAEVVVTGSRIRRLDYEANSPIVSVDQTLFEETGTVGVETILNQLPQFVPALTQFETGDIQNGADNTVGSSTVSLRGLGANRNLVLVDGRRAQPVNATLVVDTNSIPSSAIERVEIISGGASAVYGADAVGGVVNFILKNNYEGATIDMRYGVTDEGDNEEYTISGLFGANFANGEGNVMFGMDYSSRAKMLATDTDWRRDQMLDPNVLSLGSGNDFWIGETYITSEGAPFQQADVDSIFPEVAPGTISPFTFAGFYIDPNDGDVFTGGGFFGGGAAANGAYKYVESANFVMDPSGVGGIEYKDGLPWRKLHPNGQFSELVEQWVSVPLDRFSFFSKGTYDFNDSVTGFMQAQFSRNRNSTFLGFSGAALGGNRAVVPYGSEIWADSLTDPNDPGSATKAAYLPGGAYGLDYGSNPAYNLAPCPAVGGCTETQVFPLPAEMRVLLDGRTTPDADISVNRSLDFMGGRRQSTRTTTFQLVTGLEGELDNGWAWDATLSHGQTETNVFYGGFTSLARWREVAGAPNFGRAFARQGNELGAGRAAGIATCTSGLPLIEEFQVSDDCVSAIEANNQNSSQLEQNYFQANLTGDLFDLPSGPLSFAVGAEYRNDEYVFITDNLTTNESFLETTLGNFPTSNTTGRFSVEEVYAELLVPVLSDLPGIQALNLELGGRYSDYSTVGGVDTAKFLVDWTINDWSRVRGGYQKATRAPNLAELFLASTQRFAGHNSVFNDQCSQDPDNEGPYGVNPAFNVNGQSGADFARQVCEGLMGAAGAQQYYMQAPDEQSTGLGLPNVVGNPNIQPEEAETWTLGLVIESPFADNPWLSSLRTSIDWYEIEIEDMIANEGADPLYERCLSQEFNPSGSIDTAACQAIIRDPVTGNVQAVEYTFTNEGRALTSGIDIQVDWNSQFSELGFDLPGGLSLNVLANYNAENITQANEDQQEIEWVGTQGCALGLQCMGYDYRIFSTMTYFNGPFNASLRWQYYPDIKPGAFATDPDTDSTGGINSSYSLFTLSAGYALNDTTTLRVIINNPFDKLPPLTGGDPDNTSFPRPPTRAGGAVYDPLGRRIAVSASMRF